MIRVVRSTDCRRICCGNAALFWLAAVVWNITKRQHNNATSW